jgi:hypothetical protein
MAPAAGIMGPLTLRLLRAAVARTSTLVRTRFTEMVKPIQLELRTIPLRASHAGRQPIHRSALVRQQKRGARLFSTAAVGRAVRRFVSSQSSAPRASRIDRASLPSSDTSRRVGLQSGRAPFASALRPNLTGGAMPRSAGGYGLSGGGVRYFSHTPAAPAQVVQNVSQAMRAFLVSGQKLRYDGVGPRGERKYRAVSNLEDEAMNKLAAIPHSAPGSFIDFRLSPTVTALSPLAAAITSASAVSGFKVEALAAGTNLNTEGFLDVLSADFGRALQDLTAIYADMRRLAVLGDLPVTLEKQNLIRVRFPGVDAETVNRLCDDIGVQRGVVKQDPDFDASQGVSMALKFPFAPDTQKVLSSPGGSARSLEGHEFDALSSLEDDSFVQEAFMEEMRDNPWLSEPEGYGTMTPPASSGEHCSTDFEGLEGIYRFLEECDRAKGRVV